MKRFNFLHSSVSEKVMAGNFLKSLSFILFIWEFRYLGNVFNEKGPRSYPLGEKRYSGGVVSLQIRYDLLSFESVSKSLGNV